MTRKRWPRLKNDLFSRYCADCRHWNYLKSVGCAHIGVCQAIKDEPTEQDAYDTPCGLWERAGRE